ncbi:MAG: hypothetical protein GXY41_11720 [Phycisphaerae bacterium]|nr:hypothetical protein [Phycisphaerae bacterium]
MAIIIDAPKPVADGQPRCQFCGGRLVRKTLRRGIFTGICVSFLLLGLGILACLTVVGIPIGIPLILLGLFWGGKRQKVLMCTACRATVGRA